MHEWPAIPAAENAADQQIRECLDSVPSRNFFLYAGAGSGKTRSLKNAIEYLLATKGDMLDWSGRRVAVIAFTNAAAEEIASRIQYDPRVHIATIHSLAWELIKGFNDDIRAWLASDLKERLSVLHEKQERGRPSQASLDRAKEIVSKGKRLELLPDILAFTYNPNGDNASKESLNHAEVIAMAAAFLSHKPLMQSVIAARFPYIFVDECQDTHKELMEALLTLQEQRAGKVCIGLFGDTMQMIYANGIAALSDRVPTSADWCRPAKNVNYRSAKRIVELVNSIRNEVDEQWQEPRADAPAGHVRLFLVDSGTVNPDMAEARARASMAGVSGDASWDEQGAEVKMLTLEHHMAARRLGFDSFFEPLYRALGQQSSGLLDGTNANAAFLVKLALPLVHMANAGDAFGAAALLRKHCPLLDRAQLELAADGQAELLRRISEATRGICSLSDRPIVDLVRYIASHQLLELPDGMSAVLGEADGNAAAHEDGEQVDEVLEAWREALGAPVEQLARYSRYIDGKASFDTHQGVKGLQFPRVMVIISDEESRGFMFSYDKLTGAKEKTKTDIKNEQEGKDTSIARTRRLYYVCCSRAIDSLAVVHYTDSVAVVQEDMIKRGWFKKEEVEVI